MSYFWSALRYYAVFKGRTHVKAFWVYQLIITIVTSICWIAPLLYLLNHLPQASFHDHLNTHNINILADQLSLLSQTSTITMPPALELLNNFGTLFFLATLIPTFAICARRLHDSNHSAALLWLILIPLIGFIIVIFFLTLEGTPGDNRYGPNPKNAPDGTVI